MGAAREAAGLERDGKDGWAEPARPAKCRWALGEDVSLHGEPGCAGTAHYSGTIRCGSIWACPVCAAVIRAERSVEAAEAIRRWQDVGGGVSLLTLTLRHRQADGLAELLDVLKGAWRTLQARQAWRSWKARVGLVGYISAYEVTVGLNGWHPHSHLALLTEAPLTEAQAQELRSWLSEAWAAEVVKRGGRMPSAERGVDLRVADGDGRAVARYLAKLQDGAEEPEKVGWGVAAELARSDLKEGRKLSRTPFELLDSAHGNVRDRELWLEYVAATKGLRSISWSRGLRDLLGMEAEREDQEILDDAERAGELGRIPGASWRRVRDQPDMLTRALDLVERGRVGDALTLLGGYEVRQDE